MGCTNKIRSNAPRVRIGTDTIFSIALYRHDGEIGTSPDPNMGDIIDPNDLASIEAEVRTEFGGTEGVDVNIDGKLIKLEVTKEMTERLGLGCYKVRFQVRELDSRFSDGYRDVTLLSELCRVVPDGADAGLSHGNISVVIANLAEGKSAYQSYLDTTKDEPKMTEEEWASNGWLIMLETLKKLRGTKR